MYFRFVLCAVALYLGSPFVVAGQAAPDNEERTRTRNLKITKLTLEGVKAIDEQELLQNISIAESGCVSFALTPICWITTSPIFYKKFYLDREELARDLLRARVLYFKRGYRHTTIDTVITPKGDNEVHVTLKVTEGPPTTIEDIVIDQTMPVLSDRTLGRVMTLEKGEPFDLIQLDSVRQRLQSRLWSRGYADATVDTAIAIDTATKQARITFKVDPKWRTYIRNITIYGNEDVEDTSILQSLLFKPGDLYRTSTALESQRSLYESNLFRQALIELAPDSDSLKHVRVIVKEAPLREARISAGFNTLNFFEIGGRYTNYNWFGKARRFSIQGSLGNLFASSLNGHGIFYDVKGITANSDESKYFKPTYTVSMESRRPWFLSPSNEIALGLFLNRRSVPGVYVDRGYGATGTFTRRLAERAPASLNYRFEVTNIDAGDLYFCVNNGVCDDATLTALRNNRKLSPLALSASIDRTNNSLQPRRGWRGQLDAEVAASFTVSDFRYTRFSAEGAVFFPMGRESVIGIHLRGGYVNPFQSRNDQFGAVLHPRKRFYAGGSQSVRGFGESQLGPRVLTIPLATLRADSIGCPAAVAIETCDPNSAAFAASDFEPRPLGGNALIEGSIEYRFPLFFGLTGASFVDAAFVSQNINRQLQKSRTAITPGFGVRYVTPVGPIRVDMGINPFNSEVLPVVTEDSTANGRVLKRLLVDRKYEPAKESGWREIISRLQLHLSIGEAF